MDLTVVYSCIYMVNVFSPSGCTFWGRKPWSRKKKIMWQLGTLVGAPIGIGLVAGVALPAMIIGKSRLVSFMYYKETVLYIQGDF